MILTKDFVKHLRIKRNAIKTWRFGDEMSPLSSANGRGYELIYIGIEGVKHNYIKFEEQKNEIIKWKVLLERSWFWVFKDCLISLIKNIS